MDVVIAGTSEMHSRGRVLLSYQSTVLCTMSIRVTYVWNGFVLTLRIQGQSRHHQPGPVVRVYCTITA